MADADAGGSTAQIPGVELDLGGAIYSSPARSRRQPQSAQPAKRLSPYRDVAQLCGQVRKIAMRITTTAITATEIFVKVTNVRYVCS